LVIQGKKKGTLRCREGLVQLTDKSIYHVKWEDVELWIQQQMDKDRWSELALTVDDDYMMYRASFDVKEARLHICNCSLCTDPRHGNTTECTK
jgi:hypothetical protein